MTTETLASRTSTLLDLLDEELRFSPSVHGRFSNHLAMTLAALHQLGADSTVLRSTFDRSAPGSEPRGDVDALRTRLVEVERDGIAATVGRRLVSLADGPGTALFHPLIRLGYGLDLDHGGQVAAALLDWETRHQTAPEPASSRSAGRRLADVAAELSSRPDGTWPRTFDLDAIARRPELRAALTGLAADERTLDDLSAFVIQAHTVADDFITLHLVTGVRALRVVCGSIDGDLAVALTARAAAVAAVAYAAVGAPPLPDGDALDEIRSRPLPTRDRISAGAVAAHDPHVIKLVDAAAVEETRTGDLLYRNAAARVVGLAPPADPT